MLRVLGHFLLVLFSIAMGMTLIAGVSVLIPPLKFVALSMVFVMALASLLTWAERRQSSMMQDRLGPNRAQIMGLKLWGITHFIADSIKMMFKEDVVPDGAHKPLFTLAPFLALAPALIIFAIIPFGPTVYYQDLGAVINPAALPSVGEPLQVFQPEFGILFYFAIASISNYGAALAGWSSYNKFSLLGGLRATSQMLSYEVAMGLAILGVFLVMNTLEPGAIVAWQGPTVSTWGIVVQPFAFFLFFIAAIAETKRAPFDLPEGEPEIIGYFTEYSGLRFGLFFLGEFVEIVFVGAIITTVFFGGYHVPMLHVDGFHFGSTIWHMPHWSIVLLQLVAWAVKVIFFCWLQLLIRWTLPRFRPDQLMTLGWKRLLPASLVNVMATAAVLLWRQK